MKYYRFRFHFYAIKEKTFERISMYRHCYGIEKLNYFVPDMQELEEITEAQYNRVKRLILKKII